MSEEGLPVVIPATDGSAVTYGWAEDGAEFGWTYPVPVVACRVCAKEGDTRPINIESVRVTGGISALVWKMRCPRCGTVIYYPGADYRTEDDQ